MEWFPTLALRKKALKIMRILVDTYHVERPNRGHAASLPAVDELMLTLLSQSTTDINSWRGYEALKRRFSTWEEMADADVEDVEKEISVCGLSRQKAPRMLAILRRLREERGRITLDFVADMPIDEALEYLMSFNGVGRKTASCVMLFSLDMPVMPVDTHVLRVSRRLGLIPSDATADQAHNLLEALLPEESYMPFHVNMIEHGRQTCTARNPACERCPLLPDCPFGRTKFGVSG